MIRVSGGTCFGLGAGGEGLLLEYFFSRELKDET